MDPYEYDDVWADVWEPLPRLVKRDMNLAIDGDDPCEPRVAVFTRRNGTGRIWRFPVQPNGQISELDLTLLCLD